jgi:hypothetical protein
MPDDLLPNSISAIDEKKKEVFLELPRLLTIVKKIHLSFLQKPVTYKMKAFQYHKTVINYLNYEANFFSG